VIARSESPLNGIDEIALAEAQVQKHKAELSRSLHEAASSGKELMQQVRHELKPAMQTALVVAGAAALVSAAVIVVERRRRRSAGWLAPQQPSALGTLAKTAGLWAMRLLAKRVAQELVSRLEDPSAKPHTATPSTAPTPS
jgi:hypothetical protein